MKKWIPLIIVLVTFIAAGSKLLTAKQYGALCAAQDYTILASAPAYFCDAMAAVQPGLF